MSQRSLSGKQTLGPHPDLLNLLCLSSRSLKICVLLKTPGALRWCRLMEAMCATWDFWSTWCHSRWNNHCSSSWTPKLDAPRAYESGVHEANGSVDSKRRKTSPPVSHFRAHIKTLFRVFRPSHRNASQRAPLRKFNFNKEDVRKIRENLVQCQFALLPSLPTPPYCHLTLNSVSFNIL